MAVLLHVIDEDKRVTRHNSHVKRDKELEVGELGSSGKHLGDTISHPVIRTDIEGKSIDSDGRSDSNVVGE